MLGNWSGAESENSPGAMGEVCLRCRLCLLKPWQFLMEVVNLSLGCTPPEIYISGYIQVHARSKLALERGLSYGTCPGEF